MGPGLRRSDGQGATLTLLGSRAPRCGRAGSMRARASLRADAYAPSEPSRFHARTCHAAGLR